MFKELIRANDGSQYETANSVVLIDLKGDERSKSELEDAIRKRYTTEWCNCSHDCCGHWRTTVNLITMDLWVAVVHLRHSQNV
jgi:hypothetical protein